MSLSLLSITCIHVTSLKNVTAGLTDELKDENYRDMNKEISNFKNSEENKNKSNLEVTIIFGKGKRKNILLFSDKNLPSKFFIW